MTKAEKLAWEAEQRFSKSDYIANSDYWTGDRDSPSLREATIGLGYAILALIEQGKPENVGGDK